MRPTTLVPPLAGLLALAAAASVLAQDNASLPPPPVLRAREAACEERLQTIYRQRSEGVGKTYPSV